MVRVRAGSCGWKVGGESGSGLLGAGGGGRGGAVEGCCGVGAGWLHKNWEVCWWHVDNVHC